MLRPPCPPIYYFYRMIPAIVTDIDGVLIRGKQVIPGSSYVLSQVLNRTFRTPAQQFKFPFVCLTNGGGMLE